jgi:diadenosine tetraphosphate (Ap4A) HIT family hydrolase
MENPLPCPFCSTNNVLLANSLAYVRPDKYRVTAGHVLIIPVRHESDFLAIRFEELEAIWALVGEVTALIDSKFHPDGHNLGANAGEVAGQTICACAFASDPALPRGCTESARRRARGDTGKTAL